MAKPGLVTAEQIQHFLEYCPFWSVRENKLHRDYLFTDFKQAFAFMTEIAKIADEMDHHPEWFNVYNRLSVELTTHDKQGVTGLDIALAGKMETLFETRNQ